MCFLLSGKGGVSGNKSSNHYNYENVPGYRASCCRCFHLLETWIRQSRQDYWMPFLACTWTTHSCKLEATWSCSSQRILYRMALHSLFLHNRKRPVSFSSGDMAVLRSSTAERISGRLRTKTFNNSYVCGKGSRFCPGDSRKGTCRRRLVGKT